MTDHFNQLTEAEQERLAILIEECGGVIQIGCKILRHGYYSINPVEPGDPNRALLERELGDVIYALMDMASAGDVSRGRIEERAEAKKSRIRPYLHHQEPTATDAQIAAAKAAAQDRKVKPEGT